MLLFWKMIFNREWRGDSLVDILWAFKFNIVIWWHCWWCLVAGVSDIIARVSFLVFSHYLAISYIEISRQSRKILYDIFGLTTLAINKIWLTLYCIDPIQNMCQYEMAKKDTWFLHKFFHIFLSSQNEVMIFKSRVI